MNFMSEHGDSSESTGHVNLHHETAFDGLFAFAAKSAKQYVDRLHIDIDKFDFNVTKTWFNIIDQTSTPIHAHKDSHISFAYYVNVPNDKNYSIRFHDRNKHEPYNGSIVWNNTKDIWDELNAMTWNIVPKEGHLLVFPSSLYHDTIGHTDIWETQFDLNRLRNSRICIAGDILMTYKQKTASPLGIQPIESWRRYNHV
jgi:uncharacterized protein (TIGR02466 family)